MQKQIALVPGDGIGPDIIRETVEVLKAVGRRFRHTFCFTECLAGGIAIDRYGTALPSSTLETCQMSDAVLLGAVGGPKWDDMEATSGRKRRCSGCARDSASFATCALPCSSRSSARPARCARKSSATSSISWSCAS